MVAHLLFALAAAVTAVTASPAPKDNNVHFLNAPVTIGTVLSVPKTVFGTCDEIDQGFQCNTSASHNWGQYSPYFAVQPNISSAIPSQCVATFAQILSRHGARDPTEGKTQDYDKLIQKIQSKVKEFPANYSFIKDYQYRLGADQLTTFGQQELINSGIKFFQRYPLLAAGAPPFVRSSSEARVVESAQNWTQGFHSAKADQFRLPDPTYPYSITILNEAAGFNDTLNHNPGLCPAFESKANRKVASDAQDQWAAVFIPAIQTRLNKDLSGAKLSVKETIDFMDLCPFNTVASPTGELSPFCNLFTTKEWEQYNYLQTLNKYYGFGAGNPLGPSQGVGFANELIARLTNQSVVDNTSTNRTMDSDPATFPLGRQLYADFSHDSDMTAMFFALGLYNRTAALPNNTIATDEQLGGYSANVATPFAARAYFEKLACADRPNEEQVRVIVNDRVIPLVNCNVDELGRCGLKAFVDSLSFARQGGHWNQCYTSK